MSQKDLKPVLCQWCHNAIPGLYDTEPLIGRCAPCAAWYYRMKVKPFMDLPIGPKKEES